MCIILFYNFYSNAKTLHKMDQQQRVYCSISKFVNIIKEKYVDATYDLRVYFDSNDMFKNKFGQIVVKPLLIAYTNSPESRSVSLEHKKLLEVFDNKQPMITFKESIHRPYKCQYAMNKHGIRYLSVSLRMLEYNGIKYYPSSINDTVSKQKAERIISQVVKHDSVPDDQF